MATVPMGLMCVKRKRKDREKKKKNEEKSTKKYFGQ